MTDDGPVVGLAIDAVDSAALARFWAQAIDYVEVGAKGDYVMLVPNGRDGPRLLIQQVPEPKTAKNRMHLDIDAADIEREAARLEALGATRIRPEPVREYETTWIVMADPEGNEFCVCDAIHQPDLGQSGPGSDEPAG